MPRRLGGVAACAVVWVLVAVARVAAAEEPAKAEGVDFRYAPAWWQTSICLPDDWQKTLVGREGQLLYDFGGPHRGFKTSISLELPGAKWHSQSLAGARVPIVRTAHRGADRALIQEAFAAPPKTEGAASHSGPLVERLDGQRNTVNFAKPPAGTDPVFQAIAVAYNGPVRYRVKAESQPRTIVLGLCEGYYDEMGRRIQALQVEGAEPRTVDLVREIGQHVPAVFAFSGRDTDADGWIDVSVTPTPWSPDPNAFLNALWVFEGQAPPASELISGRTSRVPLAFVAGSEPPITGPPRSDYILADRQGSAAPRLVIDSEVPIQPDPARKQIRIGTRTIIGLNCAFSIAEQNGGHLVLSLNDAPKDITVCVARGGEVPAATLEQAREARQQAEAYWAKADLPYGRIVVPDANHQALLDSCVRNIYQAREIKDGLPAFQVGPTCYRGLWVVDGSFIMDAVAMVGREQEARHGIRYLLNRQGEDGGFMLMDGHWKETGIVLWAVNRHARLTDDKAWLLQQWPALERGYAYIKAMRARAATDPKAVNYRLIPAGFSDGGLGEKAAEYTNIYWTLNGLKAAAEGAAWIGRAEQAVEWQREYDDFYATFCKAAARDMKTDSHGNRCLPIYMENGLRVPPQKGQWAFCHAVYPGQLFAADDPLVRGNMAMLKAVECQGLVLDTGWLAEGLWNYFGSFYGHALLWLGEGDRASAAMIAMANHASPLLTWREEQMPVARDNGTQYVGDMPHNWASAEMLRLACHCLALERGDELHLLEGLPAAWISKPGAVTALNEVLTEFGPLSLKLEVTADGRSLTLSVTPPQRNHPKRIVLHAGNWAAEPGLVELPTDRPTRRELRLAR